MIRLREFIRTRCAQHDNFYPGAPGAAPIRKRSKTPPCLPKKTRRQGWGTLTILVCSEKLGNVHSLAADLDPSTAFPLPIQRNLHIPFAQQSRKLLSPLDQQN